MDQASFSEFETAARREGYDEIVVAVAVTDSGRPLARIGGLQVSEIKGEDGLR